jgi:hypothetical protein
MGAVSDLQEAEIKKLLTEELAFFGLSTGIDVELLYRPTSFLPEETVPTVIAFFCAAGISADSLDNALAAGVPIIPVLPDLRDTSLVPPKISALNALAYKNGGAERLVSTMLECLRLLSKQRRIFVSYRRTEARAAAVQLHEELSARCFDVFLDTHDIRPSEDFQMVLWHKLSDSDVLVMLDTPTYFESRWTNKEFGRALAKGISILRIGWPSCTPSPRIAMTTHIDLAASDLDPETGQIAKDDVIDKIFRTIEYLRSRSHALREVNLHSHIKNSLIQIGGQVIGTGAFSAVHAKLPGGTQMTFYPSVGVPTSDTLHSAVKYSTSDVAIVYDHLGMHPEWLAHLDWLNDNIRRARYAKSSSLAWDMVGWEG